MKLVGEGLVVIPGIELLVMVKRVVFDSMLIDGEDAAVPVAIVLVVWQVVLSDAGPVVASDEVVFISELGDDELGVVSELALVVDSVIAVELAAVPG